MIPLLAAFLMATRMRAHYIPGFQARKLQKSSFPLQESPEPLEVERSTGLFDSESELFRNNLMILTALLCCTVLGGIVWEVLHRLRQKMKIQPQGRSISQQLYNFILFYAV